MEASDKEKRSLSTYKEKFLTYLCKTWEMIPNCGFVEVNKIVWKGGNQHHISGYLETHMPQINE